VNEEYIAPFLSFEMLVPCVPSNFNSPDLKEYTSSKSIEGFLMEKDISEFEAGNLNLTYLKSLDNPKFGVPDVDIS
jgi:hypothetical protein